MKRLISLLIFVTFISCDNEDSNNLHQTEDDLIQYIEDNSLNATKKEAGIYYVIDEEGTGVKPDPQGYAQTIYKGYFLDGKIFDMTDEEGLKLDLLNLIPGFAKAITEFSEGSKGTILLTPDHAYGNIGIGNIIPGGAVVIFDVEVLKVYNPETEADIIAYLNENELEASKTESGLYFIMDEEGTGNEITDNSVVNVVYNASFLDGTQFDTSGEEGVDIALQNTIEGFAEGLKLFNEGGSGKLIIPPSLAYGEEGYPNLIPRNAVLIFDIQL